MNNNLSSTTAPRIFLVGILAILTLPLLDLSPWLTPPDFGKTTLFKIIIVVLLGLFAWQFLFKKDELNLPTVKNNKMLWILSGLLSLFLLASIFSVDPYFSFFGSPFRAGGIINLAFYGVFALLVFATTKEKEWKLFLNGSLITGTIVYLITLIQYHGLLKNIFISIDRPSSTIGNPISLGIYLLLLVFLAVWSLIKEKKLIYKILYAFALPVFLYAILLSGSRAAYLGLIIGAAYFLLLYPGKLRAVKITFLALLLILTGIVFYTNTQTHFPVFLENNKLFESIKPRLSIETFLGDSRFFAWQVGYKAFLEKPILGWGPENYSIGFDKYYNVSAGPQWWDRAHNMPLEIATTAGLPALILYLALFIFLFYKLHHLKRSGLRENVLAAHGLQAALLAYFIANLFSFESFSTYLLFFLFIGYSLYLTYPRHNNEHPLTVNPKPKEIPHKKVILGAILLALAAFSWQYIMVPLYVNGQINIAQNRVTFKKCDKAFPIMDGAMKNHSYLDFYLKTKYVDFIGLCAIVHPENSLAYAKKGVEVLKEAVKIRPLYTISWIYLGRFMAITASFEQDATIRTALIKEAASYLDEASKLAPNHPEILAEQAKSDIAMNNYRAAKEKGIQCAILDPALANCYWVKALSQIYLKEAEQSHESLQIFFDKKFISGDLNSQITYLTQLIDSFTSVEDYNGLVMTYTRLIVISPDVAQYHSSLAFSYSKLKEYKKARAQAMIVLKLSPQSKDAVNAFLRTLPY